MVNRFGLSRDIPAAVKRAVRQRDGFGCIKCGSAIYTYEHVDPPFEHAQSHEIHAITLLCAGCHDLVTRGHLSKSTVKQFMSSPKCRERGFSFGPLDLGSSWPEIQIGPVTMHRVPVAIRAGGLDVLSIRPPEAPGAPFRVSARLTNRAGTQTLEIVENEWRSGISSWDVELVGQRITIRDAPGEVTLVLRVNPPRGLVLERLNMYQDGIHVRADESKLEVGARGRATFTAYSAEIEESAVGISIERDGSGAIGVGGGSVHIGHLVAGAPSAAPWPALPLTTFAAKPMNRPISTADAPPRPTRAKPVPGRNEPCDCGSGIKYKRCCGRPTSA